MSHRTPLTKTPGRVDHEVSVVYGASSAITSSRGNDVTVTKVSQGVTQFVFDKPYVRLRGLSVTREGAAGTAHLFPIITSNLISTTGTIQVSLTGETGTVADPTNTNTYHFVFVFDDTGLI